MNVAVILISGSGTRFNANVPKQFIEVNNKPIFLYTLDTFYKCDLIDEILLVAQKNYFPLIDSLIKGYIDKKIHLIEGGSFRGDSSYKALKYLINNNYKEDTNVLIHDGVRMNVSLDIIKNNIIALKTSNAVLTAIKGRENKFERIDTYHYVDNQGYLAQTPQSFKLGFIYSIYCKYISLRPFNFTDDISLVEKENYSYKIIKGSKNNFKITKREDMDKIKMNIKEYKAYLFDFDGTLVDSYVATINALKLSFKSIGVEVSEEESLEMMKESADVSFKKKGCNPNLFPSFVEELEKVMFLKETTDLTVLTDDAKELLKILLKDHKKIGIISNNDSKHMNDVLLKEGLKEEDIGICVGIKDIINPKPHPEGILKAIDHLGLDKKDVCYIGDSINDVKAGINAGIDTYYVIRNGVKAPLELGQTNINTLLELNYKTN